MSLVSPTKVLIVIDMLNDFAHEDGALFFPQAAAIIPAVRSRIYQFNLNHLHHGRVIHLTDWHDEDDLEFNRFPRHAVKDTWGAETVDQLKNVVIDYTIRKKRYSGFHRTDLELALDLAGSKNQIGGVEVEVIGVCTSICVMDTVGGLSNRDIPVSVVKDCVADFDEEAAQAALKRMEMLYGAKII